jgi:hypothetical protein
MGLFSWLAPTPDKRLQKAQKHLVAKRYAQAREEVLGLEYHGAEDVLKQAETGLTQSNLEAALSWAQAGDEERVERHLDLASRFHTGGLEAEFKEVRRAVRELREGRQADLDAHERRQEAKLLDYDATAFRKDAPIPSLPQGLSVEAAEQAMMQISLILENYPKELQATVPELDAGYAKALLELDDNKPDAALQTLLAMNNNHALVRYERSRAAFALGDPAAAEKELKQFAKLAKGHYAMGRHHTAEFLAQVQTAKGDLDAAIQTLVDIRKTEPKVGSFLFAQLLFAKKRHKESETLLRGLISNHPRQTAFYKLLAIVRVDAGLRVQGMRALEQALEATHCAPGTCGFQPPDPEVKRLLATLYLEDGIEEARAKELISEIPTPKKPAWEDLYLSALSAKQNGAHNATQLATSLLAKTPSEHPAHARATQYLG